jgi:hypothetical protein
MAHATPLIVSDLSALLPSGGVVIAMTDDGSDPRYASVRAAAIPLAATLGAKVVLFHAPVGQSDRPDRTWRLFERGARPDRDVGYVPGSSPRRAALRRQADSLRESGAEVAVWVSYGPSVAGLAEAVALTHASLVLMPAEVDRPGLIRRTLDYRAARIAAPVIAVDISGVLAWVRPLDSRAQDRQPTERTPWRMPGNREALRLHG